MPGTDVGMDLNSPPGFGSKVCCWLGPPSIQRRMHALRGRWMAADASDSNHGTDAAVSTPAIDNRMNSRRESENSDLLFIFSRAAFSRHEKIFRSIYQCPEDTR